MTINASARRRRSSSLSNLQSSLISTLCLSPQVWLEAGHMDLASRDPELRPQDQLLVGDELAVLSGEPVVAAVVGKVDDLLAKTEIGT
jgi:hypothetical protein